MVSRLQNQIQDIPWKGWQQTVVLLNSSQILSPEQSSSELQTRNWIQGSLAHVFLLQIIKYINGI